jgi:hypothetical protein
VVIKTVEETGYSDCVDLHAILFVQEPLA